MFVSTRGQLNSVSVLRSQDPVLDVRLEEKTQHRGRRFGYGTIRIVEAQRMDAMMIVYLESEVEPDRLVMKDSLLDRLLIV